MMLGDSELQALDGHLSLTVRDNQQHHENLQGLLQKFQGLMESYNRLKSDYEEATEAREKWKKMARGQERNPFVLVLVDGDGYLFKDHLIRAGNEGGITAANLLSDYVKEYVHAQLGAAASQCRIMVRIYANVLGLSKTLGHAGLVGREARSLAPFTSSFTRSEDLFDYVDAGDKKEGADHKIREMFRLFADNNQCKHIFFAGCHDVGYLSLLTPYRGKADRITLLRGASFHREYETLNLPIWEIPSVFVSTPLSTPLSTPVSSNSSAPTAPSRPVCTHWQKGKCKYGSGCTKQHIMSSQQLAKGLGEPAPKQSSWVTPIPIRSHEYYSRTLPPIDGKASEYIAVNMDDERIDSYCPLPPREIWDSYMRRAKQHKLCNNYQLGGICGNLSCEFDHSDVELPILRVMGYILRSSPCPRRGKCRSIKCYTGHHCQKDKCKGGKGCRFGRHGHSLDLQVAKWVTPSDQTELDDSPISEVSGNSDSLAEEVSPYDMAYRE